MKIDEIPGTGANLQLELLLEAGHRQQSHLGQFLHRQLVLYVFQNVVHGPTNIRRNTEGRQICSLHRLQQKQPQQLGALDLPQLGTASKILKSVGHNGGGLIGVHLDHPGRQLVEVLPQQLYGRFRHEEESVRVIEVDLKPVHLMQGHGGGPGVMHLIGQGNKQVAA